MPKVRRKAARKAHASTSEHEVTTVRLLIIVKALPPHAAVRALLAAAQKIVAQGQEDAP